MISVCTKVEIKFEREVEKKEIKDEKIDPNKWKKALFFMKSKSFESFIENLVEFYEPIDDTDKERIFLTKH